MTALQGTAGPVAALVTAGSLAAYLSLTAHIAARNVLGDVKLRNAFGVGPVPAAIAALPEVVGLSPLLTVALALLADGALFAHLYGQRPRLAAYVTLIHAVVSVILGVVLFGLLALVRSAPT